MGKVFGPREIVITSALSASPIPIGAHTATIYSKSFSLAFGVFFALALKAAGTTVNLKVELEQSDRLPVTEGAADSFWTVPTGVSAIVDGLADSNIYLKSLSPIPLKYGRLKISTKTGNTADTTLEAKLSRQEEL